MDKLLLGRYVPGDSVLHRLDPRSKLLSMFVFLGIIFWANNIWTNLLVAVFLVGLVFLSGIRFSFFTSGLRPMVGLIVFTTVFQVFFTPGTDILWSFWLLKVSVQSLQQAGIVFARFLFIIVMSTLLTLTTTPLRLADGVEAGLAPLKPLKFPVHEIGLLLSMSLRFVPTLMDDTQRIMNAQRSRGVDFDEGSIVQKVKAMIPILIPLFVSSFKRAEALGTAMEARGYQGGDGRTKYRTLKWQGMDTLALLILLALSILLYTLKS